MNLTDKEREKELKLLKNSYEMYEKSKKDTETRMKQKMNADGSNVYSKEDIQSKIKLIQEMQDDIIDQYAGYGGNPEDLTKKKKPAKKAPAPKRTVSEAISEDEPVSKPVDKREEKVVEQ